MALGGGETARFNSDGSFSVKDDIVGFASMYSDRRLKDNIKPVVKALDIIKKLDGISYIYKVDKSQHYGLIAQDVEKVLPDIIKEHTIIGYTDEKYKTIMYVEIIPFLIEAVKELESKIHQLELDLNYWRNYNV